MAVSKRLRFEVLRRDNHTCRYCGRHAPEVKITVDHVVPVTLGGLDDPANLVAACVDCNAGKSSASADAALVADVSTDAMRWSAAIRQAAEELKLNDNTEVYEGVVNAWTSFRRKHIPADYRETIDQFLNAGLPGTDIIAMARVADAKPSVYDRWSYFCGCCWTRIRKLQERAEEILGAEPWATYDPAPLTTVWTAAEIEDFDSESIRYAIDLLGEEGVNRLRERTAQLQCRHGVARHCGDPVCAVEDGTLLMTTAHTLKQAADRDNAVCAEAEALLDLEEIA